MTALFSPKYNSVVEFKSIEGIEFRQKFRFLGLGGSEFKLKNFSTVPETRISQNGLGIGAELHTNDGIHFRLFTNNPNHYLSFADVNKLIGNYKYWKYGIY